MALSIVAAMTAAVFLSACGSDEIGTAGGYSASDQSVRADLNMPEAMPMPEADYAYDSASDDSYFNASAPGGDTAGGTGVIPITAPVNENLAEKIIFSYYAEIESLNFDETIANINNLIAAHGAFIESSDIRGNNYADTARGNVSFRNAYYVIRVPVGELNAVTSKLNTLGNIVNQRSNAENITAQFTDQESRLTSLRIQEERLLEMLSQATRIADMITIEDSLRDIRYQIEWITSTLTNWQRMVDYSTLTLSIQEVEEYREITGPVVPQPGYWEKMGNDFMQTLRSVGNFFASIFMWLVVSAPVLLILAVIAVVITIIIKKQVRKAKERRKNNPNVYGQQYYPYNTWQQDTPPQDPANPQQEEEDNKKEK